MRKNLRTFTISVLLGVLLLGGLADISTQAQDSTHSTGGIGAQQLLQSFFSAMGAADLALLQNGGVLSGTIQGDQFTVILSDSGQLQTLERNDITSINFGETSDQLMLVNGNLLSGTVQMDNLSIILPEGTQITIPKDEIMATVFKIKQSSEHGGGSRNHGAYRAFHGLQSQNLFTLFARSLATFDLAIFSNQQLLSGAISSEQFVFHTTLFGTLTVQASDLSGIELSPDLEEESDFISLKTGDRLAGILDEESRIQFQPIGLADDAGQPVTLIFERGDVTQVNFRLPVSAFGGGGQGPGFGGGPGH